MLGRKYIEASNTVDYTFSIDRGPTVTIRTEGVKVSQGTLKRYVPVFEEGAVDDDLLNEGKRNLVDYFQTLGFFGVKIDVTRNQRLEEQSRRHRLCDRQRARGTNCFDVDIEGNKYFPEYPDPRAHESSARRMASFPWTI